MVLALDTSTPWMCAALWSPDGLRAECQLHLGRHMLARTASVVEQMLSSAGVGVQDLSICAGGIGPGSYTGLRIGLSIVQAMAAAKSLPLFGVRTSAVVAAAAGPSSAVYVLQETGRRTGQVAMSLYDCTVFPPRERLAPSLVYPQELGALWQEPGVVVGDAVDRVMRGVGQLPGVRVAWPESAIPRAALAARIAWHRFTHGERGDPSQVEGLYLTAPPVPSRGRQ